MTRYLLILPILILFSCPITQAATVTVGSGEAYETIAAGMAAMGAGDTMIVKDGTYNEDIENVPAGSVGNYTYIQADNDGGAIVDGLSLDSGDSYIQIEGFKISDTAQKNIDGSDHIKILRTAFEGGGTSGNVVQVLITNAEYILLEDCWMYGSGGRYNLLIYQSDYIIARRCVIRHDGGWSDAKGDPEAGTNAYTSSYVYYQNCIIIDSDQSYHNWYGSFYSTTDGTDSNIEWLGCIALKNDRTAYQIDPKYGKTLSSLNIEDCVAYEQSWGMTFGSQGTVNGTVNRATIVDMVEDGMAKWGSGGTVNATNSIVWDVDDAFDGVGNSDCYVNDPTSQGLEYPPRIETGSYLKTAGSGGGQIGAQIMYKRGTSGTLYGDSGWNTLTGDGLWPFPNEGRIKTDMSAVSVRGFCAPGESLTEYIWEYMGNTIPADIYGGTVSITASDTTASEIGPATGSFTVSCTGCSGGESIDYAFTGTATDATDYIDDDDGTIAYADMPATVTITPSADSDCEGDETVVVTLENPTDCAIGSPYTATITIADDVEGDCAPPPTGVGGSVVCVSSGAGSGKYNSGGGVWVYTE